MSCTNSDYRPFLLAFRHFRNPVRSCWLLTGGWSRFGLKRRLQMPIWIRTRDVFTREFCAGSSLRKPGKPLAGRINPVKKILSGYASSNEQHATMRLEKGPGLGAAFYPAFRSCAGSGQVGFSIQLPELDAPDRSARRQNFQRSSNQVRLYLAGNSKRFDPV